MTSLEIRTYDRRYLEDMVSLYNAETEHEAHIAPLTAGRFMELVEQKSYFDAEGLFIALEKGRAVGWVHACLAPGSEAHHDPARKAPRIRMLIYQRDRVRVGYTLVAEATKWLRMSDQNELLAMHAQEGYPFYRGLWMGGEPMGPVTMPHVQMALEVGGFKNTQESIFLVTEMHSAPSEVRATVDIEYVEAPTEMMHEPMRESWVGFEPMHITAMVQGEEAGSIGWVLQTHLDRLSAPCMNVWSLGVKDKHRRKGIASALVSRAMQLSYAQGSRFASVGTQLWNAPAHATYAKLGFWPHTILVGRTLRLDAESSEVV